MNSEPVAFFITFTVYGSFLQGDRRWWRSRTEGAKSPQPRLEQWHRDRLKHDVLLLRPDQRDAIKEELTRLCDHCGWKLWRANPRSNHVHVVVTATGLAGRKVLNQIKANCTRVLRERWPVYIGRPVWTSGGDCEFIDQEDELERVVRYVDEAQDRVGRDG
ncbi:transposase [Rhodopirellula sp. P2]|uniref:transposase n=1 Tax=Rhodopirellula sp. P2 TaxID=2127060 RepID=UPI002367B9CD|nr:transposase [Rhodopirellula sp. P2]WDQ15290.1 transposase [Rhodopirellula sp. P2]